MTKAVDAGIVTPPSVGRLVGVDVARAVAIIGMLAVNVGPTEAGGVMGWLYTIPHGRASVLFVLLAGIGVSLLTRRRGFWGGWSVLAYRAALLLVAGLALQLLDHDVNVILQTYGLLFVLAGPAVRASDRALVVCGGAVAALGPIVWLTYQHVTDPAGPASPPALGDSPGQLIEELLVTGPYPVVTWLAPFLCGVWLGRRDLTAPLRQRRLVVVGLVAAVGAPVLSRLLTSATGGPVVETGPRMLVTSAAHGQMPLWLLGSCGAAVATLGLTLTVTGAYGRRGAAPAHRSPGLAGAAVGPAPRWAWPFVAAGQLSLTIYVLHLVALHLLRPLPHDLAQGALITAAMAVLALIGAAAWRGRFRRGPLEALLREPWRGR